MSGMIAFIESIADAPARPGAYALWLRLDAPLQVTMAGRSGSLKPGDYFYCGSAKGPGGLRARLARHWRRQKHTQWHIDQITAAATVRGAFLLEGGDECALNAALSELPTPMAGFGSSDCPRCVAHLRRVEEDALLPGPMRRALERSGGARGRNLLRQLRKPDPDAALTDDCWVRIMCDCGAEGVWNRAGTCVDLEELPVDDALRRRIRDWQEVYDAHDDVDGPPLDVGPFAAEGLAIARAVKAQLPDWTVVYYDEAKIELFRTASGHHDHRWLGYFAEYEIHPAEAPGTGA